MGKEEKNPETQKKTSMEFIIFLTKSSFSIILTIIIFVLLVFVISFINSDWDTGWISMTIIYFLRIRER